MMTNWRSEEVCRVTKTDFEAAPKATFKRSFDKLTAYSTLI
jgi:hypothetical protein